MHFTLANGDYSFMDFQFFCWQRIFKSMGHKAATKLRGRRVVIIITNHMRKKVKHLTFELTCFFSFPKKKKKKDLKKIFPNKTLVELGTSPIANYPRGNVRTSEIPAGFNYSRANYQLCASQNFLDSQTKRSVPMVKVMGHYSIYPPFFLLFLASLTMTDSPWVYEAKG